jgi:hypothetical protein
MRRLARWSLALLASAALAAFTAPGSALRSTLLLLPWVVAALSEIGTAPGVRRPAATGSAGEATALATLLALALLGDRLGLVFWE